MNYTKVKEIIESARLEKVYKIDTCDLYAYGWNKDTHEAMLYLHANPPEDLVVTYSKNHGVWDWVIVAKVPKDTLLKVFTMPYDNGAGYCGGLCVVAANTSEEALAVAKADGWRNVEGSVSELSNTTYMGKPCVLDSGYHSE